MKVLLVSVFPPVAAPEANHALHLSEQLAAAGVQVDVICQSGAIPATCENMTVHPVATDWSWSDLPKIIRCIRACRPDVVYLLYLGWIYNYQPMITFLPTICRRMFRGLPCVTQFEAIGSVGGRGLAVRILRQGIAAVSYGRVHSFLGTLLRDSTTVIALSSPHRDTLVRAYSAVAERMVVLPPPPLIRRSRQEPSITRPCIRSQWGMTNADFVLMYWGYIYPGKGVETLLRAFHSVSREIPHARLALVGGPLEVPFGKIRSKDYYRMVRTLPDKLGISDRVVWTGGFDWNSQAGSEYLFAGDACVLPLDWGITLNNSSLAAATTHGLPVLGSELPGPPDEALQHGQNVYLFPPRNPEALAEAIAHLIEHEPLRERLRQGSAALAAEWHSWPRMTERLLDVLSAAQAEAGRRSKDSAGRQLSPPVAGVAVATGIEESALPEPAFPTDPPTPPHEGHGMADASEDGAVGTARPSMSVIVAAYNVEKYLSQCLDSLVNQTLKNIEILVINDASTDNSAQIAEAYRARHPSVRIVTCRVNQGLASVRNIGMLHARGDYVAFVDGDDWVDIRMCEVMYGRAVADDADVLSASATVYYDDRKTFAPLFDQKIRQDLDPQLKAHPFDLLDEPRALLLEVVAWTKLYKRSFLISHDLRFEDGLNSYEDICFHIFCMLKAKRISVIDDPLIYYRQNRPGQISGRTDRKVFEVFEVFRRVHEKLFSWEVGNEIWGQVLRLELRQYDWLLTARVPPRDKADFIARAAEQLRQVPDGIWQSLHHSGARETAKRLCLRRGWQRGHRLTRSRTSVPSLLMCLLFREGRRSRAGSYRFELVTLATETKATLRSVARNILIRNVRKDGLKPVVGRQAESIGSTIPANDPANQLVHVCQFKDQVLFVSGMARDSDLVRRVDGDFYLSKTAILREGDIVVDVGAHVGLWSIHLAKKFPFVTVYALEPDPGKFACLAQNIVLNKVNNIVPINAALARTEGRRPLYVDPEAGRWTTINAGFAAKRGVLKIVDAETTTLERLCSQYGIQHCRVLKVSAWGAVKEVLESIPSQLQIDYLCGEVDLDECGKTSLEVASWRSARHFFWQTTARTAEERIHSCLHQLPQGIEPEASDPVFSFDLERSLQMPLQSRPPSLAAPAAGGDAPPRSGGAVRVHQHQQGVR